MIDVEVNLSQETVPFPASSNILHFCRTEIREMLGVIFHQRIIHPGTLKARERRRSLAPHAKPRISIRPRTFNDEKPRGIVEIAFVDYGLGLKVTRSNRGYWARIGISRTVHRLSPSCPRPGRGLRGFVRSNLSESDVAACFGSG